MATSPTDPVPITEHLHLAYRSMRAWYSTACLSREPTTPSPYAREEEMLTPSNDAEQITSVEQLHFGSRIWAGEIMVRVGHHIGALCLCYSPADPMPQDSTALPLSERDRWPRSAAITLARAILEGASTAVWLLDPALSLSARLARTARLSLWSANHFSRDGGSPDQLDEARRLAIDAGLRLSPPEPTSPLVRRARSQGLSPTQTSSETPSAIMDGSCIRGGAVEPITRLGRHATRTFFVRTSCPMDLPIKPRWRRTFT